MHHCPNRFDLFHDFPWIARGEEDLVDDWGGACKYSILPYIVFDRAID
jgi:hypothetical protein